MAVETKDDVDDTNDEALEIAGALRMTIGLFLRHLRQLPGETALGPEALPVGAIAVMGRLYKQGAVTASDLARAEQISPQSMGATFAVLESHGYIQRRPDPADGRRVHVSLTSEGEWALFHRRDAKAVAIANALRANLTPAELRQLRKSLPLIQRLAESM